ncbi:MAG: hypothetical protein AAYR33_02670 [Acetobacteraceae bacterium]
MQPTASGEGAIIASICEALPKLNKRDRITELYSGMGTLTLPLSAHGFVEAYEGGGVFRRGIGCCPDGKMSLMFSQGSGPPAPATERT